MMLKALKLNSDEARLKFPRLLQLVELYPAETLDLMVREVRDHLLSSSILGFMYSIVNQQIWQINHDAQWILQMVQRNITVST